MTKKRSAGSKESRRQRMAKSKDDLFVAWSDLRAALRDDDEATGAFLKALKEVADARLKEIQDRAKVTNELLSEMHIKKTNLECRLMGRPVEFPDQDKKTASELLRLAVKRTRLHLEEVEAREDVDVADEVAEVVDMAEDAAQEVAEKPRDVPEDDGEDYVEFDDPDPAEEAE